jgi:hypothetical protein
MSVSIVQGVITGGCDYDCNAIITVWFTRCNDETVWDECVTKYPNVRELYFNNCSAPTDLLLELCGRVDVLQIEYCETEFAEACILRFSGKKLRVIMRDQFLIPMFSVARLKHLELVGCVITDNVIVGARLLEFLDLTKSTISDTQMRRVIDNIQHTPLKSFWMTGLSDENCERLKAVYCKGSMLSYVSVIYDKSQIFAQMTSFVSSRWFKVCVTLLASEGEPLLKVGMISRDIWRLLFSEYLPK